MTRSSMLATALLVSMVCVAAAPAADDGKPRSLPRVPEGFTIEVAAESPLVKHPMMAGFDDRGRLFVAESAGENLRAPDLLKAPPNFVRMLEDTDGDGRFDKSTIFADKMTLPMGALWYRGALYVAAPPSIWKLEDTDDDGVADRRAELVDTFGFSGNAASVHGCFLGPNGRLYWCDGRHGHEFKDDQGRVWSQGKAARIFSCRPDGSDVQVFCGGGMDNPVEVDFTPDGEMIGSVNILLSRPRVDCLMHWVEGGVYPRHDQEDCIAEFPSTGDLLPPMTRFGHVAVSGMTRYRSDHFGDAYRGNVFTTIFNTHKVIRSVLTRSGSTFTTKEQDFFVTDDPDSHPTDVLEDADGSLLVVDTGGWFRIGCPTSKVAKPDVHGVIYRIRKKDTPPLADPRGLQIGLEKLPPADLADLLDDPRPAVRERAVDLLAQQERAAVVALRNVLAATGADRRSEVARRNAVWSLSRMSVPEASDVLVDALKDKSESVRLAAARSLGTNGSAVAVGALSRLVVADTPAVRQASATALGRICDATNPLDAGGEAASAARRQALESLFAGIRKQVTDRFLEHAILFAAIRIGDRDATVPYLDDPNPAVRRAALISLDQMKDGQLTRELVTPLLDTDDPALQQQALSVIGKHEGWAAQTLKLLRTWLADESLTAGREAVLRGFLLAQSGDAEIQSLVADSFKRSGLSKPLRLLLLEVMFRSPLAELPGAWLDAVGRALRHNDSDVRLQAIRVVQDRGVNRFDTRLTTIAGDERVPPDVRVEALIAVAGRLKDVDPKLEQFLFDRLNEDVPPLSRLAAARALSEMPLDNRRLLQLANNLDAAGPLAVPVLLRTFSHSQDETVGLALATRLNESPAAANLSPDEVGRLFGRYPRTVQQAAAPLFKRLGADPERQRLRLEELSSLLTGGDPADGRRVFFGKKAACAGCHTVDSEGGKVGPDLTKIGRIRTGRDLLEAVAFPSATFARGYRSYVVVTNRGRIHTGVIGRQTADTVSLRTADLAEIRIPRDTIDAMKESSTSIMPKGLDKTLSDQELRDLLTFIQGLK